MGLLTSEQFTMSLDSRFKSTSLELPKNEGRYVCIVPDDRSIHYCQFRGGFFEKTQNFEYTSIITRYRVHFWIEEELYEQYKREKK